MPDLQKSRKHLPAGLPNFRLRKSSLHFCLPGKNDPSYDDDPQLPRNRPTLVTFQEFLSLRLALSVLRIVRKALQGKIISNYS